MSVNDSYELWWTGNLSRVHPASYPMSTGISCDPDKDNQPWIKSINQDINEKHEPYY